MGFEPTRACTLPVFKTGAINHSTTPPSYRLEKCAIENWLGKRAPDRANWWLPPSSPAARGPLR